MMQDLSDLSAGQFFDEVLEAADRLVLGAERNDDVMEEFERLFDLLEFWRLNWNGVTEFSKPIAKMLVFLPDRLLAATGKFGSGANCDLGYVAGNIGNEMFVIPYEEPVDCFENWIAGTEDMIERLISASQTFFVDLMTGDGVDLGLYSQFRDTLREASAFWSNEPCLPKRVVGSVNEFIPALNRETYRRGLPERTATIESIIPEIASIEHEMFG